MRHVAPSDLESTSDPCAERAEGRALMLERAARMCLELAEAVHGRVMAEVAEGGDVAAPVLAHARAMRALRQTVALGERMDRDQAREARAREEKRAAERLAAREPAEPYDYAAAVHGAINKADVFEAVGSFILTKAPKCERGQRGAEHLVDELRERLGDMDDRDFAEPPVSAMIMRICREMDLVVDWSFWETKDWAIKEAMAETPGSPYADDWVDEQPP